MAIALIQTTLPIQPVFNEITYTASSDNVLEPGFKFIVDIYISAVKVARRRVSPNTDNLLVVDTSTILENYLSTHDLINDGDDTGILSGEDQFIDYSVRFGEEYEVLGVRTQYPNLLTETGATWNASYSTDDLEGYAGTNTRLWLTDRPAQLNTGRYGQGYTSMLLNDTESITNYRITVSNTSMVATQYLVNNAAGSQRMYHMATGFDSINEIDPSAFTVPPVQPILKDDTAFYEVEVVTDEGTSDKLTFYAEDRCEEQESTRLHFLNDKGSADQFDFTLLDSRSANITRKTMRTVATRATAAGVYNPTRQGRSLKSYNVTYDRSDFLTSNWITEAESEWLIQMLTSNEVLLERDGAFYSVVIEDTSYDYKTTQADELFLMELTVTYSKREGRQRG